MENLVNSQTNQLEPVPQDQVAQSLESGTHNLPTGQSINVLDNNGKLVSLPAEQIPEAIKNAGFKFPTQADLTEHRQQEEFGSGVLNPAAAAAFGAARAATLGGSDYLAKKTGLATPEELLALQKYNPTATTAGEFAGIGGSLLIAPEAAAAKSAAEALNAARASGNALKIAEASEALKAARSAFTTLDIANPASAIAKLGGKATGALEGLLPGVAETSPVTAKILASIGQVGAKMAGSAVEGAIYGAGQQVSESILGDTDLMGEHLAHNIGYGALFGGTLGGAFSGLGEAYGGLKGAFSKEIEKAALKDAIIENATNHADTLPYSTAPVSMADMEGRIKQGESAVDTTLPQYKRAVEVTQTLAGREDFPLTGVQMESLTDSAARRQYLMNLTQDNPTAKLSRDWEALQKREAEQKLIPQFVQEISPNTKLIDDATHAGDKTVQDFFTQYQSEKQAMAPAFDQINTLSKNQMDQNRLVQSLVESFPGISDVINVSDNKFALKPYDKTMSISKTAYDAVKDVLQAANKKGLTFEQLRNLRENFRKDINWVTNPGGSQELSTLRKHMMDYMEEEVSRLSPDTKLRETFKRYAINEQQREVIEKIFGGSISDKASFAKTIKREKVLDRIFSNTESVKAARTILGDEKFNAALANYISVLKQDATDAVKGFSSSKFARSLKSNEDVFKEAFTQRPQQFRDLHAITDKLRVLSDITHGNPSGTAAALEALKKTQGWLSYIKHPSQIPGALAENIAGSYKNAKQVQSFEESLRRGVPDESMRAEQKIARDAQLNQKKAQYSAYITMERMGQKVNNAIEQNAKSIISLKEGIKGAAAMTAASSVDDTLAAYNKFADKLRHITSSPEAFVDVVHGATDPLHQIAPKITQSLHTTIGRSAQFLTSKLPTQDSSPLSEPYNPSNQEIAQFNRYRQAVENPVGVMARVKNGSVTPQDIETLAVVYPKLYNQMKMAVMGKLSTTVKLPYSRKLTLSLFLGQDLHNTLKPQSIVANQAMFHTPQGAGKQLDNMKPTAKGLSGLNTGGALLTDTQRILNRNSK